MRYGEVQTLDMLHADTSRYIDLCFQYTDTELVTGDCYLEYVIIKHNSCTRSLIMGPKCTQVSSVVSKIETFGRKNN